MRCLASATEENVRVSKYLQNRRIALLDKTATACACTNGGDAKALATVRSTLRAHLFPESIADSDSPAPDGVVAVDAGMPLKDPLS